MTEIELRSLEDLQGFIVQVERDVLAAKPREFSYVSPMLFRGQSRASWKLETTLERFGKSELRMGEYVRYLSKVEPAIESFTGRKFEFNRRNEPDASKSFGLSDQGFLIGQYELMVYLRHHGFPTPLLDWSRSPYVALYFACCELAPDEPSALYLYVEDVGHGRTGWVGEPEISSLGHYIAAHSRHFTQQSEYTACIAKGTDESWYYHPHEKVIGVSSDERDKLVKALIPPEMRRVFLKKLDTMNINAFSLYGTEEGLMQTLAYRELDD